MAVFTLDEALALLPRVRDRLMELQALGREVDALRHQGASARRPYPGNGHVPDRTAASTMEQRLEALVDQLNQGLRQLNDWGVELKSVDEGLVDFPSERDGRAVCLCWKLGEPTIAFWHELDTGFASRQPL